MLSWLLAVFFKAHVFPHTHILSFAGHIRKSLHSGHYEASVLGGPVRSVLEKKISSIIAGIKYSHTRGKDGKQQRRGAKGGKHQREKEKKRLSRPVKKNTQRIATAGRPDMHNSTSLSVTAVMCMMPPSCCSMQKSWTVAAAKVSHPCR